MKGGNQNKSCLLLKSLDQAPNKPAVVGTFPDLSLPYSLMSFNDGSLNQNKRFL